MPRPIELLGVESIWAERTRLLTELEQLESGELTYGRRRRGQEWETVDATQERIVQLKTELVALNIQLNLRFAKQRRT